MATKRIIDHNTDSVLSVGDYVLIDSSSEGTRKYDLGNAVAGLQEKAEEITISTSGAVTQVLEPNKIYHFTSDALTALTVSAAAPTDGRYEFDFISGTTAPTVTMPSAWVMPNNFMVEPNGRYRLIIDGGYCVANRWADNHSPFTYLDSENGDFTMNSSAITAGKVYANVGTEVVSVNFSGVKLKNALDSAKYLKICDISAKTKALIGGTYVTGTMPLWKSGKVTRCIFNTWENSSVIEIQNSTGETLAAGTEINGIMFILRTI